MGERYEEFTVTGFDMFDMTIKGFLNPFYDGETVMIYYAEREVPPSRNNPRGKLIYTGKIADIPMDIMDSTFYSAFCGDVMGWQLLSDNKNLLNEKKEKNATPDGWQEYINYLHKWAVEHIDNKYACNSPMSYQSWYQNTVYDRKGKNNV